MLYKKSISYLFAASLITTSSLLNANEVEEAKPAAVESSESTTLFFQNEPVVISISDSLQWVLPTVSSAELNVEKQESEYETDSLLINGKIGPCDAQLKTYDASSVINQDSFVSDEEKIAQLYASFSSKLPVGATVTNGPEVAEYSPLVRFSAVREDEENVEFFSMIASHEAVIEGKVTAPESYAEFLQEFFALVELEEVE